jgi:hypothetical protein
MTQKLIHDNQLKLLKHLFLKSEEALKRPKIMRKEETR